MRATQHTKEIGDYDYYNAYTTSNLYVEHVFGEGISTINLTNDSATDSVQFSYDGATLAGTVDPGESVKLTVNQKASVYIKATAGGDVLRIWSYAGVTSSTPVDANGSLVVVSNPTDPYSINDVDNDGNDANPNYYGFETAAGAWYIMKEDKSTNPKVYTYAKGPSDYATAWAGRGGQSYATFGATF